LTSRSFTDLYLWGQRLAWLAKSAQTKYKNAVEREDELMSLAWLESARKTINSTIAVASTILQVEDIVKGKRITA